jgi:hypothetical protein
VPNKGPIPAGQYWIVDRPTGGIRSQAYSIGKDVVNAVFGHPSNHGDWFALYRDDGIRNALLQAMKIRTRTSGLRAYGTIEVITYGNTCP